MSIKRKGSGIAFTAIMLATLLMTVAAPMVSAVASTTAGSSIPIGGAQATPTVVNVSENNLGAPNPGSCYSSTGPGTVAPDPVGAAAILATPPAELTFTIRDSAGAATVFWSSLVLTTAPPASMSGFTISLAQSGIAGIANDTVVVTFSNSDDQNVELFAFTATANAIAGAAAGATQIYIGGNQAGCVLPGGTTPGSFGTLTTQGQLAAAQAAGDGDGAPGPLNLITVGPCAFDESVVNAGTGSTLRIGSDAAPTQTIPVALAGVLALGAQAVTIDAPGLTVAQAANTLVFQTVPNCLGDPLNPFLSLRLVGGSAGPVVVALTVTAGSTPIVLPGENNQLAGTITVAEAPSGGSLNGQTLTFTISSPASGVLFSNSPTVTYGGAGGGSGPGVCTISADRKSCTVGPIASTLVGDTVILSNIRYDVDQATPLGTPVKITVGTSPSVALIGGTVTNAFVGRVVVASAAQPIVFIGFNDQATGVVTFTESGTGFFTGGGGGNNVFGLCPLTGESFTRPPYARVTNPGIGAGQSNLLILNPATALGVTLQQGILAPGLGGVICAYWTIHTPSTNNPAVIELVGADTANVALPGGAGNPTNGPKINVPNGLTPGSVQFALNIGSLAQVLGVGGFSQIVSNAIRAFKVSLDITAVSQPRCAQGTADCLAGNIRIAETQAGQLKPGDVFTIRFLPRATPQRQDVLLKVGVTNDLPIPTANTAQSGLAVAPVGVNCNPSAILGVTVCQFAFVVTQQAFATATTLGVITLSNIHAVVAADAINGPVLTNVMITPGPGSVGQPADTVVSNLIIGLAPVPTATRIASSIAPGVNRSACAQDTANCAFGTQTVRNNSGASGQHAYFTVRFQVTGVPTDGIVDVWAVVRPGLNPVMPQGFPGSYTRRSGTPITANGFAYYHADAMLLSSNGQARASFIGVFRASALFASSRSKAVSGVWDDRVALTT